MRIKREYDSMIVHFDNTIRLSTLPPLWVFYLQNIFYLFQAADRIGRGKLLGRQSQRVEPELVDPRLVGAEYVGLEAVADHQRFGRLAARRLVDDVRGRALQRLFPILPDGRYNAARGQQAHQKSLHKFR